ncbi:MAG: prolipoprotein diacylglyceryl transferase, partial [Clostridia bacterium]|nr:prolipoprotein diacylglyceryl transferase [Clostridia bacterium]
IVFYKKKKFNGQVFLFYMTWYGFGRMFVEGLRTDSLYLHLFGLDIRISQVVGFVTFVIGLVLLIINLVKAKKLGEKSLPSAYLNSTGEESYGMTPVKAESVSDSATAPAESDNTAGEDSADTQVNAEPADTSDDCLQSTDDDNIETPEDSDGETEDESDPDGLDADAEEKLDG